MIVRSDTVDGTGSFFCTEGFSLLTSLRVSLSFCLARTDFSCLCVASSLFPSSLFFLSLSVLRVKCVLVLLAFLFSVTLARGFLDLSSGSFQPFLTRALSQVSRLLGPSPKLQTMQQDPRRLETASCGQRLLVRTSLRPQLDFFEVSFPSCPLLIMPHC